MSAGLTAYRTITRVLSPFAAPLVSVWARSEPAVLKDERLARNDMSPVSVWWHAASLGELAALAPVLEEAQKTRRQAPFAVTTTTASGRALATRLWGEAAGLAPLDFPRLTARAMDARRPAALVLVETELWPNLLASALDRKVSVGVVNARVSDRAWPRYQRLSGVFSPLLRCLTAVAARSEEDAERWAALGVPPVALRVTGNTKHDRLRAAAPAALPWPDADVWVVGSLRPGEEPAIFAALLALRVRFPRLRTVLVPRHPDLWRHALAELEEHGLRGALIDDPNAGSAEVVVEQRQGMLSNLYAAGDIAFVGGTLVPVGGHNVLEPAAAHIPVVFGSHLANVREDAEALIGCAGGVRVEDVSELIAAMERWLEGADERKKAGERAGALVASRSGASTRAVRWLEERGVLPGPDPA